MDLEAQPFDAARLRRRGASSWSRPRAAEKGLALAATIDADVPGAGRRRCRRGCARCCSTCCRNAVKFTEKGERRADGASGGDGGDELHFAVRDTGIGLPPNGMRQAVPALQPGRREPTTRRTAAPASGLVDQQAARRADGRHDERRERRPGPGLHVPLHHPRARASRRPRAGSRPAKRGSTRRRPSATRCASCSPRTTS